MRPSVLKSQPSPALIFSWQCALHSSTALNLNTPDSFRGEPSECALQAITWTTAQPVLLCQTEAMVRMQRHRVCWTKGVMGNQASCNTLPQSA